MSAVSTFNTDVVMVTDRGWEVEHAYIKQGNNPWNGVMNGIKQEQKSTMNPEQHTKWAK